jgi:putative ABC transport system substrate-binding protein
MIGRRDFIALLSGASVWPLAARAQQLKRIGVLMNGVATDAHRQVQLAALTQRLQQLGWADGQNVRIEVRWSAGNASELLRLSPDVLLASSTANLAALLRLGPTMPIVFVLVSDPVAQGFVSNMAHPGGNITGFSVFELSIGGKWIELLKRIAPGLAHVTLVYNPDTSPQSKFFVTSIETAAPSLGVDATFSTVHAAADIEEAIKTASRRPNGGLIFPTDSFLTTHRQLIVESASRHRVPAMYGLPEYVEIGGLMSYAVDNDNQFRQAAIYIDRILKGAKPGDLPVQNPTKYSFVINLKTAKALGIEVPTNLLLTANDLIQ